MKNIVRIIIFLLLLILIPGVAISGKRSIKYYKQRWCNKLSGTTDLLHHDVVLDCSTHDYIFIFEYSYRWRNAIGRALYFSLETGKRSGIVLILEKKREQFYFRQLKNLVSYFSIPVDIFQIGEGISKEVEE